MWILRAWVLCLVALVPRLAEAAGCTPIAETPPRAMRATASIDTITITFLGHSSFLIESPGGVRAVTDYNGYNTPIEPPDIATMNHAHSSHYAERPDPRIPNVLRGWRIDGKPQMYDLIVNDMHVSNLPTNIRGWDGGTEMYGNSIFLFESAGVCIAHLSHLHHLLTPDDLAVLGHVDVVMASVDGTYTLSQQDVAAVLDQLHPRLVLPMHYFVGDVVRRFVDVISDRYEVRFSDTSTLRISRPTLPERSLVVISPGN